MNFRRLKPKVRWWSLFGLRLIAHFTETLEVHTDRFVHRRGVFTKRENVVLFARITNYSTCQSGFDRLFGIANYCIETSPYPADPELELKGYSHKLRSFLARMLQAYQAAH